MKRMVIGLVVLSLFVFGWMGSGLAQQSSASGLRVVRGQGDGMIYLMEGDCKYPIADSGTLEALGYDWKDVREISGDLDDYVTGTSVLMMPVKQGSKRAFPVNNRTAVVGVIPQSPDALVQTIEKAGLDTDHGVYDITVFPGLYEGPIVIEGLKYKGKKVNINCVKSPTGDRAIIWSYQQSTVYVDIPGDVDVTIRGCTILNTYPYNSSFDPPETRWQRAAIVAAFGARLTLEGNEIHSHTRCVSTTYVYENYRNNGLSCGKVSFLHLNNNSDVPISGNVLVGGAIGHYFSNRVVSEPQDTYFGIALPVGYKDEIDETP